jgi:hypothetical protein
MTCANDEPPPRLPWYHRPIAIALLAVLVLGPLALPLVWRTPAWGPLGRWIATLLIMAYTVLLGWLVWLDVQMVLGRVRG